jgi:uncharacterized protein DUF3247
MLACSKQDEPMSQIAEQVYTEQRDIARIESWAEQLQDEAVVAIELSDGGRVEGVVTVRPTIQVFRDAGGREGLNAVVRIDDASDPGRAHYLWLDRIVDIQRIGTA